MRWRNTMRRLARERGLEQIFAHTFTSNQPFWHFDFGPPTSRALIPVVLCYGLGNSHHEFWQGKSIQGREGCQWSWRSRPQERGFSIRLSRKQQKEQQTKSHRAGWGLGPDPHLNRGNKSCLPGLHPQGCGGQGMLSNAGFSTYTNTRKTQR